MSHFLRQTALLGFTLGAAALAGPKVVIDPGHGGAQPGARGGDGYQEKVLSLEIAKKLKAELAKLDAQVVLTREEDALLPLPDRVARTNREHPDVFVSIHANSMPTRRLREHVEGIETFFLSASASGEDASRTADRENAESARVGPFPPNDTLSFILSDLKRSEAHRESSQLAYAVHESLIRSAHAVDRGIQQAPFYVLTGVEAPAILVEVGFISHPEEGRRLQQKAYQQALARAMAKGIAAFLRQHGARDERLTQAAGLPATSGMP